MTAHVFALRVQEMEAAQLDETLIEAGSAPGHKIAAEALPAMPSAPTTRPQKVGGLSTHPAAAHGTAQPPCMRRQPVPASCCRAPRPAWPASWAW